MKRFFKSNIWHDYIAPLIFCAAFITGAFVADHYVHDFTIAMMCGVMLTILTGIVLMIIDDWSSQ